jgi:molecular chaperone DnaK (HSP70)
MTEALLKRNSIPNYNDLADNVAQISPIKIRNIGSWHYHVAEDAKGQVYLIEDDVVMQNKLYERNMGVSESKFMLDGVGINQIKEFKKLQEEESTLQVEEEPVELEEEEVEEQVEEAPEEQENKQDQGE